MIIKLDYTGSHINLAKVEQIEKGKNTLYFYFSNRVQTIIYPEDKMDEMENDYNFYVDLWKDTVCP